ncbi:MAG: type 4a pilus biogenesis protein PilO [Patescibacteria group bacterium]|jgi:Tfp pilus assembly protein PilO
MDINSNNINREAKNGKNKTNPILFFVFRNFYWITFLVVATLVILVYLFIFRSQLTADNVAKTFSYRSEIERLDSLKKKTTEIKKVLSDFDSFSQDELIRLSQILPAEKDLPNLIIQLDSLAKQSGLALSSFSISEQVSTKKVVDAQQATGSVKELIISLNLKGGGYNNLKQLVSLVETNMRLMDISSFVFAPNDSGSFTLSLKTYFYN